VVVYSRPSEFFLPFFSLILILLVVFLAMRQSHRKRRLPSSFFFPPLSSPFDIKKKIDSSTSFSPLPPSPPLFRPPSLRATAMMNVALRPPREKKAEMDDVPLFFPPLFFFLPPERGMLVEKRAFGSPP